jgi:hypothetical protein
LASSIILIGGIWNEKNDPSPSHQMSDMTKNVERYWRIFS